jgi:hypothetical protein
MRDEKTNPEVRTFEFVRQSLLAVRTLAFAIASLITIPHPCL